MSEHLIVCPTCQYEYDVTERWTMCPHNLRPKRRPTQPSLMCAGTARPSAPVSVFAEDFSLLIRTPRRFRLVRSHIRVLS